MNILAWLRERMKPTYKRESSVTTEYAFTVNGVDYFQCAGGELTNMPFKRAEKASVYYEELKANIDYDWLEWMCDKIDFHLNKGELTQVAKINGLLKERLSIAPDPQLILKLASVFYFDKNESVYEYDFAYNRKKIESWKKGNIDAFFLNIPLERLIPRIDFSKVDSEVFMKGMLATNARTVQLMDNLLSGEYSKNLTEDSRSKYLSVRQSALEMLTSQGLDYTNIISALK